MAREFKHGSLEVQQPLASAPQQAQMGQVLHDVFAQHEAMLVKQTMRGCLKECLGCTARNEFKISGMDWAYLGDRSMLQEGAMTQPDVLYALEESNCCVRTFWSGGRPFELNISTGGEPGGQEVMQFKKDCGCPTCITIALPSDNGEASCPCCCFLPAVRATLPNGSVVNESKYVCDQCLFVPKFAYLEHGHEVYRVRPETCCFDSCIRPRCLNNGPGVIFNFYTPGSMQQVVNSDGNKPSIQNVWAGWKKECCSTADTFVVFFPEGSNPERKAGLLGLTFLIDFTVFEGKGGETAV